MRLSLQKSAGTWRLGEMQEIHLEFLRAAAEDASMGDCPGSRERLFPAPLRGRDELLDEDFNEEWKEFVAPELEMQFAGDVGVFLADLDTVQRMAPAKDDPAPRFRLDVPLEHGQAWFSTLNQARLLLDLKHRLHEPRDAPEDAEDASASAPSEAAETDPGRLFVLMRYEFYAWIQEWLVRNVMA